jgi:hypothetical protein
MDIRQLMDWITAKYGMEIDVTFYPDMSGHISKSETENDLFFWDNLEELLESLV